jgi:hypothetical protein
MGLPPVSGDVDRGQHPHAAQAAVTHAAQAAVRAATTKASNKASKESKQGTVTVATATHVRADGLRGSGDSFRPRLSVSARAAATVTNIRMRVRVRLRKPTGFIFEKGTQNLPEGCVLCERPLAAQPALRRRYAHTLRRHLRAHARDECN